MITGVSGSGKTSLVFDTLYHEARRRFLDAFSSRSTAVKLMPANVREIKGLGPAVAVGQNLLNRNPLSTLTSASGLHPFLRLLYANFGERECPTCGNPISVLTEDEIVEKIHELTKKNDIILLTPLVRHALSSHSTLLQLLKEQFGKESLVVDGKPWDLSPLNPKEPHEIVVKLGQLTKSNTINDIRDMVVLSNALGAYSLIIKQDKKETVLSRAKVCNFCGTWFKEIRAPHFHMPCPHCKGEGCDKCKNTGYFPEAAAVRWQGYRLDELLGLSVEDARALFQKADITSTAKRLKFEIQRRLEALFKVGLGYVNLNRSSPTLSRGESQRVRLAVALTNRLEDILHVLDEPTIGQHPYDVLRLLPTFRELRGPVIFVEHDRVAAASADLAIDLGPGAGQAGGQIIFEGTPSDLWKQDSSTGKYFSLRSRVEAPELRAKPKEFLTIKGANLRNLKNIDVSIPLGRLTIVTGISGSGKTTLVRDVLVESLSKKKPIGCEKIEGPKITPVLINQDPIGRNPRSNPATYTKLSNIIRDCFARATAKELTPSHFSFNRPEGACPNCNGMGAVEVKMRYLPSTWIFCSVCEGKRFSEEVLSARVEFNGKKCSIADFYDITVSEAIPLLANSKYLPRKDQTTARRILEALRDVGLGYISLGQASPTLSGGEAQRVKLAKYLSQQNLDQKIMVLDEPSTGLHPQDINGLLTVLDRLVRAGATIVVVEHNSDIIRAGDWIIDLGPGAGPSGGELIFAGPLEALLKNRESKTARALLEEDVLTPKTNAISCIQEKPVISIKNARVHNLKNVDVEFPKGKISVVTGVSGSGKSSLVVDVLEAEAKRRFLETLSMYERQGTQEGPEAEFDSIIGLGVTATITPERKLYYIRATVGVTTEISHHLAILFAWFGQRNCPKCNAPMKRNEEFSCSKCKISIPIPQPRHFNPRNYAAACLECHGIGSFQVPNPKKLIIDPKKPLCKGAMHSPGFFPKGYLCKKYNRGYDFVQTIAKMFNFDPEKTPWNEITAEAQNAFLYGLEKPITVHFTTKNQIYTKTEKFPGFYGWIADWDVGGTYTDTKTCPKCNGTRLRPDYLAIKLGGYNIHKLSEMSLKQLKGVLKKIDLPDIKDHVARMSHDNILIRLEFLDKVGLGYLHLNRISASLSAGEAQRIKLAGLLGSELTSLTILLDEPSRGLHPSELNALYDALKALCDEGNTVIIVEHDPLIIKNADHLIDMGPGAGAKGGEIVASGDAETVLKGKTLTALWMNGTKSFKYPKKRRKSKKWFKIFGATGNNLKIDECAIPLGCIMGICGVSGSGKSTLLIDTIGRILAPKKQTTSVAHEPINPEEYESIEGAPPQTVVIDQAKKGITSPLTFMNLRNPLIDVYLESEDANFLGMDKTLLETSCSACKGRGTIKIDMGFLPNVYEPCETCRGSGHLPEVWDIRYDGHSLPEIYSLTIDEVARIFEKEERVISKLQVLQAVGLGYLMLKQPGYSLSGGEAQRLKIANELTKKAKKNTLYILDEPTIGLHMEDVSRLIKILQFLVERGNSVVIIEHNPHLLATCDWLIELGPGGGPEGGKIIAIGTPEEIAAGDTPTAPYLREVLGAKN